MAMETPEKINQDLLRPILKASPRYFAAVTFFALIVVAALGAWGYQIKTGMGVAGINNPVFWGFYIINFVFWIGLSHAGTLISAILRLTNATWRRPITRCAEVITVFALSIGVFFHSFAKQPAHRTLRPFAVREKSVDGVLVAHCNKPSLLSG